MFDHGNDVCYWRSLTDGELALLCCVQQVPLYFACSFLQKTTKVLVSVWPCSCDTPGLASTTFSLLKTAWIRSCKAFSFSSWVTNSSSGKLLLTARRAATTSWSDNLLNELDEHRTSATAKTCTQLKTRQLFQ